MQRRSFMASLGACLAAGHTHIARASQFPLRPLRIIVPFGAGSGSDVNARYYADKMGPLLGQPVIVENKPGADGAIGMALAKSAPADGYTMVLGSISLMAVNPAMRKDLAYDAEKDFKPLFGYTTSMNVIVVPNQSPFQSLEALLLAGQSRGEPLTMGVFSSTQILTAAVLARAAGLGITSVPYKGQSQVISDVIGQQLDFAYLDLSGAATLIKEGKVRALGVSGAARHPHFPHVPAINEMKGLGSYSQATWNGLYVKSDVPDMAVERLTSALKEVMSSRETMQFFYDVRGIQIAAVPGSALTALQQRDLQSFRQVAGTVNVKLQ